MTQSPPPERPAPPPPAPQIVCCYQPRKPWWRRLLLGVFAVLFIVSVLINIDLGLLVAVSAGEGMEQTTLAQGRNDQVIAVYKVEGMIDDGAASDFARFHRMVQSSKNIKAVVIRINSTGGTVSASDQIHQMIVSLDRRMPVVVSMGGYAASGGYYIAVGARKIYAEPTTVTGSIGVLAVWPVVKDFLDKHGVQVIVERSAHARAWKARELNPFEHPTESVTAELHGELNAMQDRFEQVVRAGRGDRLHTRPTSAGASQPQEQTVVPFDGRTYMAKEAKDLGLIDEVGYTNDAVQAVRSEAGLGGDAKVVQYSKHKPLIESLFGTRAGGISVDANTIYDLTSPRIMMIWMP